MKKKKLYQSPSTVTISIRMPNWLLDEIRSRAIYADVPYQSYIKMTLADFILKKNKNEIKRQRYTKPSKKHYLDNLKILPKE